MEATLDSATLQSNKATYSSYSRELAEIAVWALIEEAELTPKPALVDGRGSGAHHDMNLAMLRLSATALYPSLLELAHVAQGVEPTLELRRALGTIGRNAEASMLRASGGCNTHRGAIWTIGLLCAAAATLSPCNSDPAIICKRAAEIARLPDANAPTTVSHGAMVETRYGGRGARAEAECGFPHVVQALGALHRNRMYPINETNARLNSLLTIMTTLDDTCLLYRGGVEALRLAQCRARRVLDFGGTSTTSGLRELLTLDRELIALNSSPGGSADLFAAALFLDKLGGDKEW